jgi:high affinity sulfate transporter 1
MAGAAITIALQQLKGFLGIAVFTKKSDIISVMKSVWGNVHHGVRKKIIPYFFPNFSQYSRERELILALVIQWNWQTILIAASFLAFLLAAKYIVRKNTTSS